MEPPVLRRKRKRSGPRDSKSRNSDLSQKKKERRLDSQVEKSDCAIEDNTAPAVDNEDRNLIVSLIQKFVRRLSFHAETRGNRESLDRTSNGWRR